MENDAELVREIVLSVAVVALFIGLMVYIGTMFPGQAFAGTAGLALVGTIALFILVMGAIGIYLAKQSDEA